MKPWAKLEQNYINHPKFLALSATAICLWHEGKNYCDLHQTDGLIPREALKTFRFNNKKAIQALLRSCGPKPSCGAFAALWIRQDGGFQMHDYLDHNDCRDEVLERIASADERRAKDRERKAEARAALARQREEEKSARKSARSPQGQLAEVAEDSPRTRPH